MISRPISSQSESLSIPQLQNECNRMDNLLRSPLEPYHSFPKELLDAHPEDNIDKTFLTEEQTLFSIGR